MVAKAGAQYAPIAVSWWGSVAERSSAFLKKAGSALSQAGRHLLHSDGAIEAPGYILKQRCALAVVRENAEAVTAVQSIHRLSHGVQPPMTVPEHSDRVLLTVGRGPQMHPPRRRRRRRRQQPPPADSSSSADSADSADSAESAASVDSAGGGHARHGGVATALLAIVSLAEASAKEVAQTLGHSPHAAVPRSALTTAAAKRADFCATLQYIVTAAHHATPDDDLKKCGLFQNYLSPRFSEMSTDSVAAELRRDGVRGGGAFVAPPRRLV